MGSKKCTHCGSAENKFGKNKNTPDGLNRLCLPCARLQCKVAHFKPLSKWMYRKLKVQYDSRQDPSMNHYSHKDGEKKPNLGYVPKKPIRKARKDIHQLIKKISDGSATTR